MKNVFLFFYLNIFILSFYLNIVFSFYLNIVCKNIVCELGLNKHKIHYNFTLQENFWNGKKISIICAMLSKKSIKTMKDLKNK